LFASGQVVGIGRIIDGDELRIENPAGSTRLRLLGIMSFDVTATDVTGSEFGRVCVDYLQGLQGRQARLQVASPAVDNEGRLLGSLFLLNDGRDLALDLVRQGLTLVYTRYEFPQMQSYLQVQDQARQEKRGLWASERVAARAEAKLLFWDQQRRDGEAGR
jgi:endonuclease YncB( thermonuclease family)